METNTTHYPVQEAPRGKSISGTLITCAGCGTQVFIPRNGMRIMENHRWWERLGWGKVDDQQRHRLKGTLFCSDCYPDARIDAAD